MTNYILYSIAGLLMAVLSTYHIKAIGKGHPIRASLSSFIGIVTSMYVIVDIIVNIQTVGLWGIVAYGIGNTIGVYATMKTPVDN